MMNGTDDLFVDGYENRGDVDRIYKLLDVLADGENASFVKIRDHSSEWCVDFVGKPSVRHANRISMFKEFLAKHLEANVRVFGAAQGSVLVEYAPEDVTSGYLERAKELAGSKEIFADIARKLGVKKIRFGDVVIEFA